MAAVSANGLTVDLGRHRALAGVDLAVDEGSFVVVAGPNGGGKTTLLRALLGLVAPSSGTVRVFEQPPGRVPPGWIGYVPQFKSLDRSFPALSCELVASGFKHNWPWRVGRRAHDESERALALVGGAHLEHRPLRELSGGELQRVYLARALVRQPRLVLLDEPATGIDVAGESDMYRILDQYSSEQRATILMVTHDWMAAHHHASHALLLNNRVVSYGPAAEALSNANLISAFGHAAHAHEHHGEDWRASTRGGVGR
jgi:zinc transport system ATP-binding protein